MLVLLGQNQVDWVCSKHADVNPDWPCAHSGVKENTPRQQFSMINRVEWNADERILNQKDQDGAGYAAKTQ